MYSIGATLAIDLKTGLVPRVIEYIIEDNDFQEMCNKVIQESLNVKARIGCIRVSSNDSLILSNATDVLQEYKQETLSRHLAMHSSHYLLQMISEYIFGKDTYVEYDTQSRQYKKDDKYVWGLNVIIRVHCSNKEYIEKYNKLSEDDKESILKLNKQLSVLEERRDLILNQE